MTPGKIESPQMISARAWSRRLMTASVFGILFFTLFPYWVDFSSTPDGNRNPFTLGGPLQFDGVLHSCLNTLLFVPFGFALFAIRNMRWNSWLKSVAVAFGAGWLFSYAIEIVQMYMPTRDSAWDDVIANALGSMLGMLLGLVLGDHILRKASEWESRLVSAVSVRSIAVLASVYFGIWLVASIPLQHKTRLNNWDQNPFVSIGNDVRRTTPWDGQVSRLEIWNKSLGASQAEALANHLDSANGIDADALAAYNLSHPPPVPNRVGLIPRLVVNGSGSSGSQTQQTTAGPGMLSLISESSLPFLSDAVAQSNRVSVSLDCVSKGGDGSDGTLVSISSLAGNTDFSFQQRGTRLVIILRTGLTTIDWYVDDVFAPHTRHSLIVSYDGSFGVLFVDGKKQRSSYSLSPGVGLVHLLTRVKTSELEAYDGLYDCLVFLPLGFLLGLAARIMRRDIAIYKCGILFGILLPAIALEVLLVGTSGRRLSYSQLFLSIGLTIAGMLWINLDSVRSS